MTETALTQDLEEHPDYPGMLSVGGVLKNFDLANIALNGGNSLLLNAKCHSITFHTISIF
ncbi:hypothetical protein [Chitinophaga silvisoli]|uniref:Uncharacterized protein n=1 Tax=Chitinophaga silvisoli TaxID=2291814 RepID=A0A3E1NTI1_9BACT|nr:hypothetical protein [Chitinophaga silvisoli]RFM31213.1 hypothetical protein DXN04_30715 [Chitinophaga silvisoli]